MSGDKRSATVRHRMYDQISKSPRKYRPKDMKTRTKDQRIRGPKDQRTKGPEDQGTRGPRDQRDQGTKGAGDQGTRTKGPKDQVTREPANQDQRSRGNSIFDTTYFVFLIGINFLFDRNPAEDRRGNVRAWRRKEGPHAESIDKLCGLQAITTPNRCP